MSAKKRILLVDDDEFILTCIKRMLEKRFDLDVAQGANDALEVFTARGPFAVILSDMRMPGMGGIQLISRAQEFSPSTVGLLLSGDGRCDETDEAIRNGIVLRLLDKPCEADAMAQAIEEALETHESLVQVTA